MEKVLLGRSGLEVSKVGLELSLLEKLSFAKCKELLDRAIESGITFFDIGMPSEELQKRIGHGTVGSRSRIVLAGSFVPSTPKEFEKQLQMELRALKTDYLDLCQIHDPDYLPRVGDEEGVYDAMLKAKEAGYIRSIGITTGSDLIAFRALDFGWYDTLQYPWSSESGEEDLDYVRFAAMASVGTISVPQGEVPSAEKIRREMALQGKWEGHSTLFLADETFPFDWGK